MSEPYIEGPIADSWVIARGKSPNTQWLTPSREWQGSIFEAARFELHEREKAEWWLARETVDPEKILLAALTRSEKYNSMPLTVSRIEVLRKNQSTGLTDSEMTYWAERINSLCDDMENEDE